MVELYSYRHFLWQKCNLFYVSMANFAFLWVCAFTQNLACATVVDIIPSTSVLHFPYGKVL